MKVLSVCTILILGLVSGDQKPLMAEEIKISLDQTIELMKKEHPDIHLQEIAVEKATDEVKLASRDFFPDVEIDYIASSASGGLGLILTAAKLFRPIFTWKQLTLQKETKKILKEKEKVLIRLRELDVTYAVKELYVMQLIQRELLSALRENVKRSNKRYQIKKIHYEKGGINKEELLKEELEYETAKTQAHITRTWLRQTELAFTNLLGFPPDTILLLEPILFSETEIFPLNFEESLSLAYKNNPLIQALTLEEKASWKLLGKREPRFSVDGGFVGLGESSNGLFSGKPRFGVTGNFVLHDWGKRGLQKRIQGLRHQELRFKHQKELQRFETEIAKSYFDLKKIGSEINTSKAHSELYFEMNRRNEILHEIGRLRETKRLSFKNEHTIYGVKHQEKLFEYYLVRERLIKDLGFSDFHKFMEAVA